MGPAAAAAFGAILCGSAPASGAFSFPTQAAAACRGERHGASSPIEEETVHDSWRDPTQDAAARDTVACARPRAGPAAVAAHRRADATGPGRDAAVRGRSSDGQPGVHG